MSTNHWSGQPLDFAEKIIPADTAPGRSIENLKVRIEISYNCFYKYYYSITGA